MKKSSISVSEIANYTYCPVSFLYSRQIDLEELIEEAENKLPWLKKLKNPSPTQIRQIEQFERIIELEERKRQGTLIHEEIASESRSYHHLIAILLLAVIICLILWLT